jgi:hypothetical protein
MKKKNIFLILLVLFILGNVSFLIIKNYNDNENKRIQNEYKKIYDELNSFLDKEKDMNVIIGKLGEPTLRLSKEQYPIVEYARGKCSNEGTVLIWDKKNQVDKKYILMISFLEKTNKISTVGFQACPLY